MNKSQIEPYPLPSWVKAKGLTYCFVYHGHSMTPTFQNGDLLYLRSPVENLRPGDVIVFTAHQEADYVVHRVTSIFNEDIITRGDHNRLQDASLVSLAQIVGEVEIVETKHGIHQVANGVPGLWVAGIWRFIFGLDRFIRRLFWSPYNLFRERRLASILWQPQILKLQLHLRNSQQIKYIYRNRTVAIWDPSCQRFYCRKPFDLVIPRPENAFLD